MRGRRRLKVAGVALAVVAAAFAILLVIAHRPAIAAVERLDPRSTAPALVARGANLARIGNCVSSHQSGGGRPYAGGYPVETPFGTIYGSNITPDLSNGIGRWSRAAFARALREGVGRDGSHLYPAYPYTHYAGATDSDATRSPFASRTSTTRVRPR